MSHPVEHPLLPAHTERSGKTAAVVGWLVYAALLGVLLALLPPGLPRPKPSPTILTLGVIGTWRWSWGALHLCRSLIYKRLVFPRIRRRADLAAKPPAVYVLVTSYRMAPMLNAAVYGRLFDELAGFAVPAVIVACVTDHADAAIIEGRFARRTFVEGHAPRDHRAARPRQARRDGRSPVPHRDAATLSRVRRSS